MTYSTSTQRAIKAYGIKICMEAFRMHDANGEGGSTVGFYLGLTTRQADAAINAGREIQAACALRIQFKTVDSDEWKQSTVPGDDMIVAYSATSNNCFAPSRTEAQNTAAYAHAVEVAAPRKVVAVQVL